MLSQDGQKSVVKQLFELAPTNKLLWSTDGHWFPETYALANTQMREVLSEVSSLCVLVLNPLSDSGGGGDVGPRETCDERPDDRGSGHRSYQKTSV